jgi:TetR/AcrR family transcriptional regulator, regulator of mycofactocin system
VTGAYRDAVSVGHVSWQDSFPERAGSLEAVDLDLCGRRERKKLETRLALEAAALRLFDRCGFDATTVEDICDEVDVSTRTFNRYFPRKEDVLFADHESELEALRRSLAEQPPGHHLLDPVRAAVRHMVVRRRPRRDLDLMWVRVVNAHPALRAQQHVRHQAFAEAIRDHVADRLGVTPDADPRPELLGACCLAIVDTAMRRYAADPSQDDEALIDLLFDTLTGDFDLRQVDPA